MHLSVSTMQMKNTFGFLVAAMLVILYLVWTTVGGPVKPIPIREHVFICQIENKPLKMHIQDKTKHLPTIYFVTPTYPRREQAAELTRLGQTLMHVSNLHWIVADDNQACNPMLEKLLKRFGMPFTHIASPMPEAYRTANLVPRGVANRRAALNWIRDNGKEGVLYFGDDDNTFDLRLFDEIRTTKKVSMFPVGLIGYYAVSSPIVQEGKVVGFFDSWPAGRLWPVDMAGFAVNLSYLGLSPNATMPYEAGYEEDKFLKSLGLVMDDIEPKAWDCTEILVWHTQTTKTQAPIIQIENSALNKHGSLRALLRELESLGVGHTSQLTGVKTWLSRNGKSEPL